MPEQVPEATLRRADGGLMPEGDGWFVVNVAEAEGIHTERFGDGVRFEGAARFPGLGINVRVLQPGQPCAMYHRESAAEAFLVLSGSCVLVIEGQERTLRKGDFVYSPPGTTHVIAGAGDGPCSVLMAGARPEELEITYPVDEVAARYGASVEAETTNPREAYGGGWGFEPTSIGQPW